MGSDRESNTVTVTFIANYEVDPEDFDMRLKDPEKIQRELCSSAISGTDRIQQTLTTTEGEMERYRQRIEEERR